MADILEDEWWKQDKQQQKDRSHVKKSKRKNIDENPSSDHEKEDETLNKKRRKRQRITEEILSDNGGDEASLLSMINAYCGKAPSLKTDDFDFQSDYFTLCNIEKSYTISSYLKAIFPKWTKKVNSFQTKMSPLILVLCGNALRASHLNGDCKSFKGDNCKSIKLFSRHMKLKDQAKTLKNNIVHFAVGTPARVAALLKDDLLSLEHTKFVILDWNWRDIKLKRMIDIPEVCASLILLIRDHILPSCKNSNSRIGLF